MKNLLIVLLMLQTYSFAYEPIKIINPDKNTKIEIVLIKPAKEFGGNLRIAKGSGDFEVILCNEKGFELKRTKLNNDGNYNFGALNAGKYYLKLHNNTKKAPPEFIDKAAPNIMDIPYMRPKT